MLICNDFFLLFNVLMNVIPSDLVAYIEQEILPRYADFDAAHQMDHARQVIEQSLHLAEAVNASDSYVEADGTKTIVSVPMVYAIAAYHDTGLCEGREHHHEVSARIIRDDATLLRWFSPSDILTMADAAEDHRASSKHAPRTIYGRIVAEADRLIDPETVIRRTIQFGLAHYPTLPVEAHYARTLEHLQEKYGDGGYLQLWIPESPNAERLEALRVIIRDPERLKPVFQRMWLELSK